jgi:DeoR/GlpR family transcriptional regulator of sugar metabolism
MYKLVHRSDRVGATLRNLGYGNRVLQRERDDQILRALRARGTASAAELAGQLGVSTATIRRDLQRLDRNGELTRVYGGAVLDGNTIEPPFDALSDADGAAKDAVAARACEMIQDEEVVLLDIGTTTLRLARLLHDRAITVITNNTAVFDELRDDTRVQLVLLGGMLRRNYKSLVGSLTEDALRQISVDRLFLSCTGVRRNGYVVDNMQVEAPSKRAMVASAQSVVLMAPALKFPGSGSLRICSFAELDTVITTDGADAQTLTACREAGGEVLLA